MSSGEVVNATNIVIEPTTLHPGQIEVRVSLKLTSNIDLHAAWIFGVREGPGEESTFIEVPGQLSLEQGGDPRDGTWSGTITFPLNLPDGNYGIICAAYVQSPTLPTGSVRSLPIAGASGLSVRLQRSTTPDTERPEILSYDIQPRIIEGPSNATSYFSVSAEVRDNIGVVFVAAQARMLVGSFYWITGEDDIPQMSLESGVNNNPQSGRWSGRLQVHRRVPNGDYRVNFYAFDAAGNVRKTFESLNASNLTVTVQRTAPESDNEPPSIVASSSSVQPQTLGPGQSEITLSVNARDNRGVQSVTANISSGSAGSSQSIGTVTLQRSAGSPQDGTWTGRFVFPANAADGEYRVNFRAVDVTGNSTSGGPVSVILQRRQQQRPPEVPTIERNERTVTTFTFPGPATIQNLTSESGECEIRVSVPRRVVMDCKCPQRSANRKDEEEQEGTRREEGGNGEERRPRIPLPRIRRNKSTAMLVLSIAAIVIAGGVLAAYALASQQDNKCNSWLTRLQNQILGLLVITQLNDGPSRTQAQTDMMNTMAAEYSTEITRFNEECGTR